MPNKPFGSRLRERAAVARIISAISFALRAYRAEALDVRLVHYKGVKGDFSGLEKEFGPKKKKGAKKKR